MIPENIAWLHWSASSLAAFLASLAECVEALTIVLAVGITRGWRSSLCGVAAGFILLTLLVVFFNPLLRQLPIPFSLLQLSLGGLLFIFGANWLRKAVLRAAGRKALHDQTQIYSHELSIMKHAEKTKGAWDWLALITCFKAIVVEGLEVVFIVVAVGGAELSLVPAATGAATAALAVITIVMLLHRPLRRVPENSLKFAVGVILSAFGIFWIGKGIGFGWPGGDLAIIGLMTVVLIVSLLCVKWLKKPSTKI